MNNDYIEGFLKSAQAHNIGRDEAMNVLKAAAEEDPSVAAAAGLGAPGPEQLGAGQPPLPGGEGGEGGIPPEIEELIQSLPPEVLQQLMAEIEQEISQGQGGPPQAGPPGGMPPQGGPPPGPPGGMSPGMPKQGSDNSVLLCKTAEYVDGFFEAARDHGLTRAQANQFYKEAATRMETNPIDLPISIDTNEKKASHYEGFVLEAVDHGFTVKQAEAIYLNTFVNK